jgi:hypothetical protein
MASTLNALICAGLAIVLWTCIGLPVAIRVAPRSLALMIAPAIGWAVHSAIAFPIFCAIGMSRTAVSAVLAVSVVTAIAALRAQSQASSDSPLCTRASIAALVGAALLAFGVMAAILPKISADGAALASPIFDHSKVALIDEMARLGVPPGNPFFGEVGAPTRLSYYYLWHFSAAVLAVLAGVSGWEADAGLTWFTAFASLALIIGFASWLSGRAASGLWVVVLAGTASMRPVVFALLGQDTAGDLVGWPTGFGGWLFQTTWAPQHMASAMCAALAVFLLARLAERQNILNGFVFALVMVAGFESSTWVGGVTFPLAAAVIALILIARCGPSNRSRLILCIAGAAVVAIGTASPLLYDQFMSAAMRGGGLPIKIEPYEVLGFDLPAPIGQIVDLPAYWMVFLVAEFPAFYLTGGIMMALLARDRQLPHDRKSVVLAFAVLTLISLSVSWLLVSTLGNNNDLGWRGALPAVMLLIVFAAIGLSRLSLKPASLAAVAAFALVVFGLPEGAALIYRNIVVELSPQAKVFAATPTLWDAVRRHSDSTDRVVNNSYFLQQMTPWPINISWALQSNRRSCFAGGDFAPFIAIPRARVEEISAQFARIFDGKASPEDIGQLANQYKCSLVVITTQDGAWTKDPLVFSQFYHLTEENPAGWRIYKAINPVPR